jgi:hypothetical protein
MSRMRAGRINPYCTRNVIVVVAVLPSGACALIVTSTFVPWGVVWGTTAMQVASPEPFVARSHWVGAFGKKKVADRMTPGVGSPPSDAWILNVTVEPVLYVGLSVCAWIVRPGIGVAVAVGVTVAVGTAVGTVVAVPVGATVTVGSGVSVGVGVAVLVAVGIAVAVGTV